MRGAPSLVGSHAARIDGRGLAVFPQAESLPLPVPPLPSRGRVSSGFAELDDMTGGGLPGGSVTMLAGAPGTGKSILGLQYLMEGARQGDRSLLLAFRERPEVLVSRARAFGMDLEGAIAAGLVQILHRSAATLEVDEALGAAREALGASSPARIVIDSIAELEQDLPDLGRRRRVMAWITDLVRAHGATGLILRETGQIIGPELEFSDSPLAVLAENVILLRYVELDRRLSRVVSILKVRDSAHDPSIREYEIAQTGAQVIAAGVGDPARLSRIAGLPEERRVKREGGPSPVSDPRSAGDDR
jgi:circadian clock protein KaiC